MRTKQYITYTSKPNLNPSRDQLVRMDLAEKRSEKESFKARETASDLLDAAINDFCKIVTQSNIMFFEVSSATRTGKKPCTSTAPGNDDLSVQLSS